MSQERVKDNPRQSGRPDGGEQYEDLIGRFRVRQEGIGTDLPPVPFPHSVPAFVRLVEASTNR